MQSMEEEIIKAYKENMPLHKIYKRFEINSFDLAYILGKHGVERRKTKVGGFMGREPIRIVRYADATNKSGVSFGIPANTIREMGVEIGERYRFSIISKEQGVIVLRLTREAEKEE